MKPDYVTLITRKTAKSLSTKDLITFTVQLPDNETKAIYQQEMRRRKLNP
jgi:hypothetical protein